MKVGFLDFQLTNSHFKKFHSLLTGEVGGGQVEVVGMHELEPTEQGRQWCTENNARYVESAEELVSNSDALLVLAPNNPEKHLQVAAPALSSGKPVYIDKLLADTPEEAGKILKLAGEGKSPVMCASSLRFAAELEELDKKLTGKPETVFARGYGKFPVYAVHTIAMALRYFGADVQRVIDTGAGAARLLTVEGGAGRAFIEVRDVPNGAKAFPWQVGVVANGKHVTATVTDTNAFYVNLMRETLEFYRTGKSPVSPEEQLATVKVQWGAEQSAAQGGTWVDVSG